MIKIFTSKKCLNCFGLKQELSNRGIKFEEVDGTKSKSLAYLRVRKVNILQLPIIENEGKFFTYEQYMEILRGIKS